MRAGYEANSRCRLQLGFSCVSLALCRARQAFEAAFAGDFVAVRRVRLTLELKLQLRQGARRELGLLPSQRKAA